MRYFLIQEIDWARKNLQRVLESSLKKRPITKMSPNDFGAADAVRTLRA